MRLRLLVYLALLFPAGVAAHADTIVTFNFTGISIFYGLAGDQNTLSGMATVDTTTGVVEDISFTAGGIFQSGVDAQYGPIVYVGTSQSKFSFDAGSLIGYTGSAFDLNGPNDLYVGHGMMAPVALTPEPSTVVLLGTGLLGLAGVARRRLVGSAGVSSFEYPYFR